VVSIPFRRTLALNVLCSATLRCQIYSLSLSPSPSPSLPLSRNGNCSQFAQKPTLSVCRTWSLGSSRHFSTLRLTLSEEIFENVPAIVFIINGLDLPLSPTSFQAEISIMYCVSHDSDIVKLVAMMSVRLTWYQGSPISRG